MSLLDVTDGDLQSVAADPAMFIVTQPLTIGNVRLIAAGWLSLNASAYATLTFLLVLALATSTLWFVRNAGRSTQ